MNERIRELRRELKKSQAEFGKALGLSQRAISEMEVGTNEITQRNFDAICKTFSVNPDWLRDGVGEMFVETREAIIQSVVAEFGLTPEETILVRMFLELDNEQRSQAMTFITDFVKTMAAKLGVANPLAPQRQKPDSELTPDEAAEAVRAEFTDKQAAAKRGITTSSVSITSSG